VNETKTVGEHVATWDGRDENGIAVASGIYFLRLESAGHVTLTVYDVTGRRVRTLTDTVWPAGEHVIRWDGVATSGAPAPSGVYFFRLKTAIGIDTRRGVLAK